jgi:hypothetical protein
VILAVASASQAVPLYAPGDVVYGFDSQIFRVAPGSGAPELIAQGDLLAEGEVAALEFAADGSLLVALNVCCDPRILRIDKDTGQQSTVFEADRSGFFNFGNLDRVGDLLFADGELGNGHVLVTIDLIDSSLSVLEGGFIGTLAGAQMGILADSAEEVLVAGAAAIVSVDVASGFQTLVRTLPPQMLVLDMTRYAGGRALATSVGVVLFTDAGELISIPSPRRLFHIDLALDGRLAVLSETEVFLIDGATAEIETLVSGFDIAPANRNGALAVVPVPEPTLLLLLLGGLLALAWFRGGVARTSRPVRARSSS